MLQDQAIKEVTPHGMQSTKVARHQTGVLREESAPLNQHSMSVVLDMSTGMDAAEKRNESR